jgi:diguanylate cyclase
LLVIWLVLAIAIGNLGLGYLAAASLMEPPFWTLLKLRFACLSLWPSRKKTKLAALLAEQSEVKTEISTAELLIEQGILETPLTAVTCEEGAPATIAGVDELPPEWLAQLATEGIIAESFIEGAAHVLRLEIGRYREQLAVAETRARALAKQSNAKGLKILASDLCDLNEGWLATQHKAAELLHQRTGQLGEHENAAAALDRVLADQASEIRAAAAALTGLDERREIDGGGKCVLDQCAALLDRTHGLRDRIVELFAMLVRTGNHLESLSTTGQTDATTGLPNRTGLETLLLQWWASDAQRSRSLSAIGIDIDRFSRLNQRFGTRIGDQILKSLSGVLREFLQRDLPFDHLVRTDGEKFVFILGDTGPREALATAERIRQSLEASTFAYLDAEFELTVSCGVLEVGHIATTTALLKRVEETVLFAKRAGRNRCSIDEGSGPVSLDPPQFPVQGRVIKLAPTA